jgi:hypothetical protein
MTEYLHFLTDEFTVGSVTFQAWMPLAAMIFVIWIVAFKEKL